MPLLLRGGRLRKVSLRRTKGTFFFLYEIPFYIQFAAGYQSNTSSQLHTAPHKAHQTAESSSYKTVIREPTQIRDFC